MYLIISPRGKKYYLLPLLTGDYNRTEYKTMHRHRSHSSLTFAYVQFLVYVTDLQKIKC